MARMNEARPTIFGRRLAGWRRRRGLSQLELAARTGVSQRHLSFIETGRSRPGADVVDRVAEALEIPLRERNTLLESAGLAPRYPELALSDEAAAPFRDAIATMLATHEPYPAYVVDRWWNLVDVNEAGQRLFPLPEEGPTNVVDVFLGPGPLHDMVENFPSVAWAFVERLRTEVAGAGPDERLEALLERAEGYLADVPRQPQAASADLVICPVLRLGGRTIRTLSMIARFGTARAVTIDELRVELVFPGDAEAAAFFAEAAARPG